MSFTAVEGKRNSLNASNRQAEKSPPVCRQWGQAIRSMGTGYLSGDSHILTPGTGGVSVTFRILKHLKDSGCLLSAIHHLYCTQR